MADQPELKVNGKSAQISAGEEVAGEGTKPAQEQNKMTLKGMLMMAACCAVPLLLLAAIPFLGAAFGSLAAAGSGFLSVAALLACPVGMYLMMRMMMKDKK